MRKLAFIYDGVEKQMNALKNILLLVLFVVSSAIATTNETDIILTPIIGDCENGYGKAYWDKGGFEDIPKGTIYEGYFKNKLPDGFGKLSHPSNGIIVVAEFKEGKLHGFGVSIVSNKLVFAGNIIDNECVETCSISTGPFGDYVLTTTNGTIARLLPEGELERREIYKFTPTIDTNSVTGIFIPENLDACFMELERGLTPEFKEELRTGTEDDMNRLHHGLGTFFRNNWGLWKGSPLSEWFNENGIYHPDDMSAIILTSFWRHLNGKPINLEEQIKPCQDYWDKVKKEHSKEL